MTCSYAGPVLLNRRIIQMELMELTRMRDHSAPHGKRHLAVACRSMHEVDDVAVRSTRHRHPVH